MNIRLETFTVYIKLSHHFAFESVTENQDIQASAASVKNE